MKAASSPNLKQPEYRHNRHIETAQRKRVQRSRQPAFEGMKKPHQVASQREKGDVEPSPIETFRASSLQGPRGRSDGSEMRAAAEANSESAEGLGGGGGGGGREGDGRGEGGRGRQVKAGEGRGRRGAGTLDVQDVLAAAFPTVSARHVKVADSVRVEAVEGDKTLGL